MNPVVEMLGWIGSGLVVVSLMQRDVRRLRIISLVASFVLGAFNVVLGLGSMITLNVVLAAVNGYHLAATGRHPAIRSRLRLPGRRQAAPG